MGEIGSQIRPTHTNFTLFVLLLAVAWHVAANARLHKYEYISLSLSSWWYPQTAAAEDRVIILLPPSSCDGWGISKILKHCPVVDMYLPSSRWYRNCSSRSNNIDSNPQTTSPASPSSSLFLKSSLTTTFLRAKVKYFLKITHICCYVCMYLLLWRQNFPIRQKHAPL